MTLGALARQRDRDHFDKMEGIPPKPFTSDRSEMDFFLFNFKRFMTMNHRMAIARDPFKKCAYFLLLIEGPSTKGWVMAQNK
jgi:hypothetical protein